MRRLGIANLRGEVSYLDSPYREALAGFLELQPRFYSALDSGGAVEMRCFRAIRDIHLGYAILDQIDAIAELFLRLLAIDVASTRFRSAVAAREIHLSQIFTTAMVRNFIDQRLEAEPLEESRLSSIRAAVVLQNGTPAHLSEEFHRSVESALEARLDAQAVKRTSDFVSSCLNQFEDEFGGLSVNYPLDPRFLLSVLIKRG